MPKIEKHVKFNSFRLLCLRNAEKALTAAEHLKGKDLNHIVYHLLVLSMEEIGKIFMTWIKVNQVENWDKESMNVSIDDHVKKLFFAIWGPTIGNEIVNDTQWKENKRMANDIHQFRLLTLYSSFEDVIESSQKVSDENVENTYRFAKAILEMAQSSGTVKEEIGPKDQEEIIWFNEYIQTKENDKFAFGNEGQEKLIELGDINEWIRWLKDIYERKQNEFVALAEAEINRKSNPDAEIYIPKWEITFTVYTPSHSLRQKDLNTFNQVGLPYKFELGKNRHTLIIKNNLPSIITVHTLWSQGWLSSKLLVAALNISSRGLFYWYASKDIDRYYDSIEDLESQKKLTVSMSPALELDWKSHRMYLSDHQLHLTTVVYEYFLQIRSRNDTEDVMAYLSAVAMFSRTDIHLRLEVNAFMLFFKIFRNLIRKHEKPKDDENVFELGYEQIEGLLTQKAEFDQNVKLALQIEGTSKHQEKVTLKEVLAMKCYCDIYFLTIAVRVVHNRPGEKLIGSLKGINS